MPLHGFDLHYSGFRLSCKRQDWGFKCERNGIISGRFVMVLCIPCDMFLL
jgi:hypothetical protein